MTSMSAGQGYAGEGNTSGGYVVPAGLQELLIEFTVSVLVEQPTDLTSYAAEYFARLQQDRGTATIVHPPSDEESMATDDDEPMPGESNIHQRRSLKLITAMLKFDALTSTAICMNISPCGTYKLTMVPGFSRAQICIFYSS